MGLGDHEEIVCLIKIASCFLERYGQSGVTVAILENYTGTARGMMRRPV